SMSHDHCALVSQLRELLTHQQYKPGTVYNRCLFAGHFLEYLSQRDIPVEQATPAHVSSYLRCAVRRFKQRRGRTPSQYWRTDPRAGVHALLRMVQRSGRLKPRPSARRSNVSASGSSPTNSLDGSEIAASLSGSTHCSGTKNNAEEMRPYRRKGTAKP